MKSTRWIVVAGWLIATPVFAQTLESPLAPETLDESVSTDIAPQFNGAVSFDLEMERLRQDIAATRSLREQIADEVDQPLSTDAVASEQSRRELLELLTKLATRNVSSKTEPIPVKPQAATPVPPLRDNTTKIELSSNEAAVHPLITDKMVDSYALGRALFRARDFIGAEQAFRKTKLTDENRVMLQYLIATCLRKQSRIDQAAKAYRIVAENKDDLALRDLALWQLENMRWNQQTELQLDQVRRLREPTDPQPESSQTETTKSPRK